MGAGADATAVALVAAGHVGFTRREIEWGGRIMALLDAARHLNAALETNKQAEAKDIREAEIKSRRVSLYKEHGEQWFNELRQALGNLASRFNSVAKDRTKQLQIGQHPTDLNRIEIGFLLPDELGRSCCIYREESDLRVICEFRRSGKTWAEDFKVIPTEQFEIKVIVSVESVKRHTEWADEAGGKLTGDLYNDLISWTEKVKEIKSLATEEFADHLLDYFLSFKWVVRLLKNERQAHRGLMQ
jgi:hypothetical protein